MLKLRGDVIVLTVGEYIIPQDSSMMSNRVSKAHEPQGEPSNYNPQKPRTLQSRVLSQTGSASGVDVPGVGECFSQWEHSLSVTR